jgi:hypothetical protein
VLFAIGHAFFDGADHITSFANAYTDLASFIAHHNYSPETELFTAFDDFGDATDLHNPLLPIGFFFPIPTTFFPTICHNFVRYQCFESLCSVDAL